MLAVKEPDPDELVKASFQKHHERTPSKPPLHCESGSPETFKDPEFDDMMEGTEEFSTGETNVHEMIPKQFISNQKRGVKKKLPQSKKSFLEWRHNANLRSFHSNHSSFAPQTNDDLEVAASKRFVPSGKAQEFKPPKREYRAEQKVLEESSSLICDNSSQVMEESMPSLNDSSSKHSLYQSSGRRDVVREGVFTYEETQHSQDVHYKSDFT